MVVKLYGTNSSTVIGQVESKMEEINSILPEGVKIVPYYEQKTLVEACVKTMNRLLVLAISVCFYGVNSSQYSGSSIHSILSAFCYDRYELF